MPIYDYRCKSCELLFEQLVSPSAVASGEADVRKCPACEQDAERVLATAPAVLQFKGNWFKNKGTY